ncbi:hypothetical protein C6503_23935 [Candidatus Poribacteria bacterium]|nr:MAG: hypothetical protein C6503_23935 [Candidatus Poribacteria bacterium]
MRHPLLPQLIVDNNVTHFTIAGDWESRTAAELKAISEGLDVAGTTISDDVDSIPSIWAWPLLFEMALYDTRHPMHLRVLGEWRGLLAMLALKDWCEFPLTTDTIDITDLTTNSPGAKDFLQALQRLRPKSNPSDILDTTTTWNILNIVEFNGKPIGITSPTTLVCTSVKCFARISGVPWFDGKLLENPVPKLNSFEKTAVAGWLNNLRESTNTLPDTSIKNNLRGLLHTFIGDLDNNTAAPTFSARGLGLTQNLFTAMNNPVAPQDLPSSIKLVPSENKEPQKTLLVFDESIAEDWGVPPQNVFVWKGKTLATTQDFSRKRKPELSLPNDIELRRPQDFFSDKLFVIQGKNAFLKETTLAANGSEDLKFNQIDVTPILPFTEELLTYFDVRDLSERITFEQPHPGAPITVSLRFNLSGIQEQSREFTIKKVYEERNISTISTAPTVAVWPNFRTPDWKAYYTYFTTDGQETFYTKPFLAAGEKSDPRPDKDDRGNVNGEITKTERFPEAMLCEYKGAKVGVLLISVPEEIKSNNETWYVGVDFGTSSTTIYNRKGDSAPQPVSFNDRILYISKSDAYQPSMVYNDFLSPKREETPFFSLFQESENKEKNEPLLDGHIYFLEDYNKLSSAKNLVSNLKWSAIPSHREHVREFLKQLCLQCAAEAINDGAAKIECNFSYPLSFTETNRYDFTDIWGMVASDCEKKTGVSHQIVTPGQSESVVAAKFFASTLQNTQATGGFTSGAVCIDIGGETSDISIWQNNELYWETSLRFAGRHIFLDLFKENPGFLNLFQTWDSEKDSEENRRIREEAITSLKSMKNNDDQYDDQFYAQADALIQDKGQVLLDELPIVRDQSAIQPFFSLISLGVAGLLYYVGLLLNHLSNNTNFKSDIPSIYIGGNGSKILHWMAGGSFNPDNENGKRCRQHLKRVILTASEFDDNNRGIEISKFPKAEAAYGLVAAGIKLESDGIESSGDQPKFLAGERFTQNETDYEWDEILTDERFRNRISVNNLENIHNFIESFNDSLGTELPVDLNATLSGKTQGSAPIGEVIFEALEKVFQNYSDPTKEISGEPIFILALKELLRAKTRQWKNVDI